MGWVADITAILEKAQLRSGETPDEFAEPSGVKIELNEFDRFVEAKFPRLSRYGCDLELFDWIDGDDNKYGDERLTYQQATGRRNFVVLPPGTYEAKIINAQFQSDRYGNVIFSFLLQPTNDEHSHQPAAIIGMVSKASSLLNLEKMKKCESLLIDVSHESPCKPQRMVSQVTSARRVALSS